MFSLYGHPTRLEDRISETEMKSIFWVKIIVWNDMRRFENSFLKEQERFRRVFMHKISTSLVSITWRSEGRNKFEGKLGGENAAHES